ncbi:MAG: hypothetical protein M0Z30_09205 [Actinomycetota bacterium]|nr:hypothetical protein [Actinomycetota bacterium]
MVTAVIALTLVQLGVGQEIVGATPQYKNYSAALSPNSPTSVYTLISTELGVTLTNELSSNQAFGSAELTIGTLTASEVTDPVASLTGWSAQVLLGSNPAVILVTSGTGAQVPPGGTVSVSFVITPPSNTPSPMTIGTVVKQSNDFSGQGNNFKNTGSDPTISVDQLNVDLTFQSLPNAIVQSAPKSGTFYDMCPAVKVTDASNGLPVAGVPVTLNGNADPGLYFAGQPMPTAGVTVSSDANGVATFGTVSSGNCQVATGVEGTVLGSGYTLSATSEGASQPATSTAFSVVQYDQQCTSTCTVQLSSPTKTTATIDASSGNTGSYQFEASFGQGGLLCDSQVSSGTADPIFAQTSPVGSGATASGLVTMTFPKAVVNSLVNNGTPLMQVCAGVTKAYSWTNQTAYSQANYPAGYQYFPYQGLVPDCPSDYTTVVPEICVLSRYKSAGASETIEIYVSDLSDPSFW